MISVVIPTYNRPDILGRTLMSILRQKDIEFEIIISVDDDPEYVCYTDTIIDYAVKYRKDVKIRRFYTGQFKRSQGWGVETYPYNVGIKHAVGDIVILNSSDVLNIGDNLRQHEYYHTRLGNEKEVVFSTTHGLTKDVSERLEKDNSWLENPHSLLFKGSCEYMYCGKGISYSYSELDTGEAPRPYHYQMSVRKEILHYLRGFDEDFYGQIPGGDDDLATRLKRYGCNFIYAPEILCVHQWHVYADKQTKYGWSETNKTMSVSHLDFWENQRQFEGIVRNASHEWGQYPRDMASLPKMSGVVEWS